MQAPKSARITYRLCGHENAQRVPLSAWRPEATLWSLRAAGVEATPWGEPEQVDAPGAVALRDS